MHIFIYNEYVYIYILSALHKNPANIVLKQAEGTNNFCCMWRHRWSLKSSYWSRPKESTTKNFKPTLERNEESLRINITLTSITHGFARLHACTTCTWPRSYYLDAHFSASRSCLLLSIIVSLTSITRGFSHSCARIPLAPQHAHLT